MKTKSIIKTNRQYNHEKRRQIITKATTAIKNKNKTKTKTKKTATKILKKKQTN